MRRCRDAQFLIPDEADERQFIEEQVANGLTHSHGVQMQIALVPNDDVELVKGSHLRWDLDEEYAVRCADNRAHATEVMPGSTRIALQPGDAVCFNAWGYHRGRYHSNKPRRTLMFTYTGEFFPTYDYFSDQPWLLEDGHLDGLSPGAQEFFGRFQEAFGPQIRERHAAGDEKPGYTRYLEQAREHVEALGVDVGVLSRL